MNTHLHPAVRLRMSGTKSQTSMPSKYSSKLCTEIYAVTNGGIKFLRKVGSSAPNYMSPHPRYSSQ
jgi:hypothetical protein